MQMRTHKSISMVALFCLAGCRTMDRGYRGMTGMTNPDKMKLQTGLRWMNPQPRLREVSGAAMVVYLRVRNSGAAPLAAAELARELKAGLEAAGYRVSTDRDEAQFTLNADIRAYGENANKDLGAGMVASTVVGGVAGAVAGHAIGGGSGRATGLGAAGGALIGAGIANVMANRNKMIEIDLVVDLRIGERIHGGVQTTRRASEESSVRQQAGVSGEAGASRAGSSETQELELHEDFLYHENRLVAHATKMGLTADEALPVVSARMATALSGVLP